MSAAQLIVQRAQMTANRAERRTLDGRPHLVVPIVALVAGVVNGELVTVEELATFAAAWNGRPVPLRHPQDGTGYISANSPEVIESSVLGQVFGMHVDGDRLLGEVWLDEEKCARLGGDALAVLNRLDRGEVVEVSTGYFCEFEPMVGEFNGKPYRAVQHNLRPDHVALLPDEVGACSVADGCGVGRFNCGQSAAGCSCGCHSSIKEDSAVNEKKETVQANDGELTPVDAGTTTEQIVIEGPEIELAPELTELVDAVREFGGVAAMMDALRGIKANNDREKAQAVARLAANSRCAFSQAELEAFSLDQLTKLDASLTPVGASYLGRNGATLAANADADRFVRFDEIAKKAS